MIPTSARVLLTGASGGLGRAMAQALQDAGAAVLGVGRASMPPISERMEWVRADVTTDVGIAAVATSAERWGANVVVHASGVPAFGPLGAMSPAQMQIVLHTNLLAPMLLTHAMLPALQRLPKAQVVFVGSALGRIGLPGFSVYGASKSGLHGFAEALRRELADTRVLVQILGPRSTRTSFNGVNVEAYNRATGTAMDAPGVVAAALVELLENETAERFLGFPERLAVRLNGLLGALLDGSFAKHRRAVPAFPVPSITESTSP